jgi:CheY-like chemotaxis protein
LQLACGDNALANDSKTCARFAHIKALSEIWLETALELNTTPGASAVRRPAFWTRPMPPKQTVVAIIDDNLMVLGATSRLLSALGYRTELYASAKEFLDAAITTEANCLLVDIQLGEICGVDFVRQLLKAGFTIPVIFMSANGSEYVKRQANEIGCIAFLLKPFPARQLIDALVSLEPEP